MNTFDKTVIVGCSDYELYCRYLSINLPLTPRSPTYKGKFGAYLQEIGVESLPFKVSLLELVTAGVLKPSLLVNLPREYFDSWTNFPQCTAQPDIQDHDTAGYYSLYIMRDRVGDLHDLLHPYDYEIKSSFVELYQSDEIENYQILEHPNGSKYIAAEVYIPYWQAYAIASCYYKLRHAASFSSDAKELVMDMMRKQTNTFFEKYGQAFERASWFKTIVAGDQRSNSHFTYGELMELSQANVNVSIELLKADLRNLLELDAEWLSIINKIGCTVLEKTRLQLTKDVYLIYAQLQLLGLSADEIYDEFSPESQGENYTPLWEILRIEGFGMKKSFISFGQYYCHSIAEWGYSCTEDIFASLSHVKGFDAWMRAFYDLHLSINDPIKPLVSFKQSRIVDALIVMSVRTEIVLREMFRNELGDEKSDQTIVDFLKSTISLLEEESSKFLETACGKVSEMTKLNNRPHDIFATIDDMKIKCASKKKMFFIRAILKFITARNYFAHHAYKDDELNVRPSKLAGEILESLIATLLFFEESRHEKA